MKITREWLEEEIAKCDKNIKFLQEKEDLKDSEYLLHMEMGKREGLEIVRFHKIISNRSCVLFDKTVPMWKRHIIRFLKHICDRLEGVDDKHIFRRDRLEKRNDKARENYVDSKNKGIS